ncbi:hypothetical protein GUJ93_ZPchr0006g41360 [Zizania palustris]|uniref:Uncharacterized protein n=1 Tax=Zizania palustris TaxID=103762 RepID=A0A8J5VQE0_ZIZPA|nr:hypothetical protein GUJ93_ZPchr0006g41360 [Zizania palustris]
MAAPSRFLLMCALSTSYSHRVLHDDDSELPWRGDILIWLCHVEENKVRGEDVYTYARSKTAWPISSTSILIMSSVMLVPSRPATMRAVDGRADLLYGDAVLPRRPASMAASFMRLARSAPLNPGMRMATTLRETSESSLLL